MIRCPDCGCTETIVVDSRPSDSGTAIRRRRECKKCRSRFTTGERPVGREELPKFTVSDFVKQLYSTYMIDEEVSYFRVQIKTGNSIKDIARGKLRRI